MENDERIKDAYATTIYIVKLHTLPELVFKLMWLPLTEIVVNLI